MINNPNNMTFAGKTFSVILYGSPGIGKTTLALSAPDPVLIDFDRGVSRVRAEHRRQAKAVITMSSYEEVMTDLQDPLVQSAQSIIVDTGGSFVSFLQEWAMRTNPSVNRQRNGSISLKGFGAVKAEFNRFTSQIRDVMGKNLIYIFHSEEKSDRDGNPQQRLMCEGAARNIVWTPCDLGGYMQMIGDERKISFTPSQEFFAKGSHGISGTYPLRRLDSDVPNDFLGKIFELARNHIEKENNEYKPLKRVYDMAIAAGAEIVKTVVDPKTAMAAVPEIKNIKHALTSKLEVTAMFNERVKALGLVWDGQTYKQVQQ